MQELKISDTPTIKAKHNGNITISRTGGITTIQNLTLTSSDGTATVGSDYIAINETVSFAAGETSKIVEISSIEDTIKESNETFSLTLTASNLDHIPAQIADSNATVTITDDEKDLLTANFNFDYETKFSDLGINIDASFSTASSTATHIYGDDTGRSGFTDLRDFTISSESLTNLLSNNSKTLEENEIAIIKNKNDTYSIITFNDR